MRNRVALGFGTALLVLAASLSGPATATIIVQSPGPGGTGINAVSANCTVASGAPNTTIYGCLNGNPGTEVQFTSDVNIQFDASGQAVIAPSSGSGYDYLQISLPGYTFDKLILNVEAVNDGSIVFGDNLGDTSSSFALDGNGNNFFTITGDNFSFVDFHTYNTDVTLEIADAQDTKQVRFDGILIPTCPECGIQFEQVPEPASIALLGGGLLFFGALRRRRRSQAI